MHLSVRAGLTIWGAPYQREAGALFSYAKPGFSQGVHFSSPKSWRRFLVVATFKPFKRQNIVVKIWQLIGGHLAAGVPPMVQLAQWLIWPCCL